MSASAFDFGGLGGTLKDALGEKPDTATQAPAAQKTGVDSLKPAEMNSGLKEVLSRGAEAAVAQLGQKDGFFGNAALKIPLPPSLQKAEQVLRMMGMGNQADELVLSMNRAAEATVPEAKSPLVNAVKQMTVEDARGILTGGDTAATEFFRGKTEATLTERFGPKVKAVTGKARLAQQYNT
ncbi:MAG: DUF4197 domain-containing protein [Gammaproteobacteria bacterium]|nr:DUF4197 domain-containing protein [Gammaproteobacteria bacterium]